MAFLPSLSNAKKYANNLSKSTKYILISEINDALPMFNANKENNEEILKDIKKSFKQKRFFKEIYKQSGISEAFRSGNELIKNAKTSLRTGEFYNNTRAKKANDRMLSDIAGFDISELDRMDFDEESNDSETDLNEQADMYKSLESDLETGFEANAEAVSQSVISSAEYTAETIKGSTTLLYSQSIRQLHVLNAGFDTLNKGIGSIIKFNQEQLQKHIKNSTQYFESTTKLLTEQNSILKEMLDMQKTMYGSAKSKDIKQIEDPLSDIINPYTGLNLKAYKSAVKKNIEKIPFLNMGNILWDMRHEIVANPIAFLTKGIITALGGDKIKDKLKIFQDNLVGAFTTINARLIKYAKNNTGPLATLASIFGIESPRDTKVDTSKFEKGPMQFNGAANKAIVEVIPTYLARIEAALTGSPAKFYNMETGKWNTAKELRENLDYEKNRKGLYEFQEVFRQSLSKTKMSSKEQDEIQRAYDSLVKTIDKNEGIVAKANFDKNNKIIDIENYAKEMGLEGFSNKTVAKIAQIMESGLMEKVKNNLPAKVREQKFYRANLKNKLESDPNSANNVLLNGALRDTADDVFSDVELSKGITFNNRTLTSTRDIFLGMYKELYNIREILLHSSGNIPGIKNTGNALNSNTLKLFNDLDPNKLLEGKKLEQYSSSKNSIFSSLNTDEFNEMGDPFRELNELIKNSRDYNDFYKKINSNDYKYLRTNITRIIISNYNELENLEVVKNNLHLQNVLRLIRQSDPVAWDIFANPDLQVIFNILRDENKQNYGSSVNALKRALNEIEEKRKQEKTSEFDKIHPEEKFSDRFKNAKGIGGKLSVLFNQIRKPSEFVSGILDKVNSSIYDIANGDFRFIKEGFNKLTGKAFGDKNLSKSGLYVLSKGEAVIPSNLNPWNPDRKNADPRKDAQNENNLMAELSQSGISVSGNFASGIASVIPSNFNNPGQLLTTIKDALLSGKEKIGLFFDNKTNNIFTVSSDKTEEMAEKSQKEANDTQDDKNKHNTFTEMLFGTTFDKKKLTNIIPKSIRKRLTNIKDYGIAGSVAGFGIGAMGGPLGILGGALIGSTVGYLKDNDEARTLLFGPGLGEGIKKIFGTKENRKYTAVGATIGGLIGGPLGVVGGAMVGSGLSFITTSEKFKEIMFGKTDENGKVIKTGLVQRMDNFFGDSFKEGRLKFAELISEAITGPIEKAMVPVGTALQVGVKNAVKGLQSVLKRFVGLDKAGSGLFGNLANIISKHKFLSLAAGGALGGMMMGTSTGGPVGGLVLGMLGGMAGYAAHKTGLDKSLLNLGTSLIKLPGKGLNFISDKLTKWELKSGNAFNWTAQERLDKGGDAYAKSNYGKFDTKISNMNSTQLISLKAVLKGIDNVDEATADAINDMTDKLNLILASSGLTKDEKEAIKHELEDNKENASFKNITNIIYDNDDLTGPRKAKLCEALRPIVESYISTMQIISEFSKKDGAKDQILQGLGNSLGIENFDKLSKEEREKYTAYLGKEILNKKETEEKNNIPTVQDATIEAGKGIEKSIEYNINRLMGYMKLLQGDALKQEGAQVAFDQYGNPTVFRVIPKQDGSVEVTKDNSETNANTEEAQEKEKAKTDAMVGYLQTIAGNTTKEKPKKVENNKKKDLDILKSLKNLGKSITDIVLGPLKLADTVLESIPIVGGLYKNAKFQIGTFAGQKIFRPLSKSILSKANKWAGLSNVRVNGKQLSNNMISGINTYQKVTNKLGGGKWAQRAGKAAGTATRIAKGVGGRVLKGIGTAIGFAADMFDSMAVANAANEAAEQVQTQDLDDNQALNSIAASSAGIMAGISALGAVASNGLQAVRDATSGNSILDMIPGKGGSTLGTVKKFGKKIFTGKNLKTLGVAAAIGGVAYGATKLGIIEEKTATDAAENASNISRISAFVSSAYRAICQVATKFLPGKYAKKLTKLGKRLLNFVTNPKVLGKIAAKVLRRAAEFLTGPAGWVLLAASAAKSFYDGFSGAESLWNPKQGEEVTILKKVICGLSSAIADFCCLDLVMTLPEIINWVKETLGFSPKELETVGGGGGLFSEGSNGMTILNVKSWMNKLDNSIFDFKVFGKLNLTDAFSSIKNVFGSLWDKITKKFTDMVDGIKDFGERAVKYFKNFSLSDVIKGACDSAKQWINNLFNFDVKERSNQLIQEDSNQLEVRQLDEDENELVEKYKASLNLNTGISFTGGTKKSNRGNISEYKAKGVQQMLNYKTTKSKGDGGYTGIGDGGTSNPELIWAYLKNKGLGSNAIAGIMGNIQQESSFSPTILQSGGHSDNIRIDGETGYGLCQWTSIGRQKNLANFAQQRGKPSGDLETQLDFMLHEMNDYPGLVQKLQSSSSPSDAARIFHHDFERSADTGEMVERRARYAEDIARTQGKGIPFNGTYVGGGGGSSNNGSTNTGIFGSIISSLENGVLGQLGQQLFGSKSFFTSGFASLGSLGSSTTNGGGNYSFIGGRTGTSRIVNNMRSLIGKIPYYASDGTNCMRTCGIALEGTPYAGMINVDVAKAKAQELGQLHKPGDGYTPRGADMCIVNNGNHMVMMTETGGTIQNGSSHNGVYEVSTSPQDMFHGVDYYISSSQYDTLDTNGMKGNSITDFLNKTLKGSTITGKFGEKRDNGLHGGVDIAAPEGTAIISPISGVVENIGIEPAGYGNYLQIKDSKGKYHLFGHLKETPKLELGNKIIAGQTVGLVGNTGYSTGPHLHYQIDPESNHRALKDGQHIDPNNYSIDESLMQKINNNNSIMMATKGNTREGFDLLKGDGDGGFGDRFTNLADIAAINKENLEGLKPIDYAQKFDTIIQLLTSLVTILGGGNTPSNFNANVTNNMANSIPATVGGGFGGGITNIPKFATTAPGKSIETILTNMIKLAKGN